MNVETFRAQKSVLPGKNSAIAAQKSSLLNLGKAALRETACKAAIRNAFLIGALIAKQGYEQFVHFIVKHKSTAEMIG